MTSRGVLPNLDNARTIGSPFHTEVSVDVCLISESENSVLPSNQSNQSRWCSLPIEILLNVLQRVETRSSSWPTRRDIVACAAVCRTWRAVVNELVRTVQESKKLTFPSSLKQPGPHERAIQCFIKRNKDTNTYFLYLGLSSTSLLVEHSKFLLVARKCRRLSSIDYIISLDADDISIESSAYVGKVRSNFMGTKFKVYDVHAPYAGHMIPSSRAFKRLISNRQVCPKAPLVVHEVVYVVYQLNVFGSRGPRRMLCTLHSIPASMMEVGCENQLSVETSTEDDSAFQCRMPKACKPNIESLKLGAVNSVSLPLILKNKAPRWHEQLQCWCLNFRGRVTVASVKNFQLVASFDTSNPSMLHHEQEKVILQFGKIGKDVYTMDYRYPLSAFEAFAMCLTSFGTKLGCE